MKRFASVAVCICLLMCFASCDSERKPARERNDDREESASLFGKGETLETEQSEADITGFDPDFTFSTTDRNSNTFDESIFAEHELTMVNFFEPWCGPCVGEMGDLELLYENYSSAGFYIIGVYSETTMESDVDQILSDNGITYPILHYTSEFDQFQTGYVPTTIFVDGEGHIVSTNSSVEPAYIGSNDYASWSMIIEDLLR